MDSETPYWVVRGVNVTRRRYVRLGRHFGDCCVAVDTGRGLIKILEFEKKRTLLSAASVALISLRLAACTLLESPDLPTLSLPADICQYSALACV